MAIPYPKKLIPTAQERLYLRSGRILDIPKASPTFKKWEGPSIKNTFGNKPLLDVNGQPVFAELALLQLFIDSGWSGRWVETYAAKKLKPYYFSAWADKSLKEQVVDPLPKDRDWAILHELVRIHGSYSGFWDVMAWNGPYCIFAEAKHAGEDNLRDIQLTWLESSLKAGLASSQFLIVEWRIQI